MSNIQVGGHVHIDQNAVIGPESTPSDSCRLILQSRASGAETIGRGAHVEADATVLQGLDVGDCATVIAAGVVTQPVCFAVTVMGIAAR